MAEQSSTVKRAEMAQLFFKKHLEHRASIRGKSSATNENLLTAHQMIFSALVSYQNKIGGKKFEIKSTSLKARMSLFAQFMQGVEITETAISEGLYPQAANLLKQELETIATIEEFELGSRKEGRVPKFSGRLKGFGRRYGEFNELAHPTREEIVESLSSFSDGDRYGPTTIPQLNVELYMRLYGNQAMLMTMIFGQMRSAFLEAFGLDWDDEELHLASAAISILSDEGIIKGLPKLGS